MKLSKEKPTLPEKAPKPDGSYGGANAFRFECEKIGEDAGYGICQILIDMVVSNQMISGDYNRCKEFILAGTCPALHMQAEEKEAKRTLYYEPYYSAKQANALATRKVPVYTAVQKPKINFGYGALSSHMIIKKGLRDAEGSKPLTFTEGDVPVATITKSPAADRQAIGRATRPEPGPATVDDFLGAGYADAINKAFAEEYPVTFESGPSEPVETVPAPEAPKQTPSAPARTGMTLAEIAKQMVSNRK